MRNIRRNHVETKKTYYRPTLPYPERKEGKEVERKKRRQANIKKDYCLQKPSEKPNLRKNISQVKRKTSNVYFRPQKNLRI